MSLIEELYDEKSVKMIRSLYENDTESNDILLAKIGSRIIEKSETILLSKPLDIFTLVCMTANFAESKEECQTVSFIIFKRLKDKNPLPYILDDSGILLAEKTLTALSFFRPAMEKRAKKGAPTPEFYRRSSKIIFSNHGYDSISNNHEKWETFLEEIFI